MSLNESIVEVVALTWFGDMRYAIDHEPHMAPGELVVKHPFCQVALAEQLREEIRLLNNAIQSRTLATLRDTILPKLLSGDSRVASVEEEVASV
jgi:hypothetical protein